jgi:phosphoenolpyruvate carboxykinase (GTP)
MCERLEGKAEAVRTPIGLVPAASSLPLTGLDLDSGALNELLNVDDEVWRKELPGISEHLTKFGDRLPVRVSAQLEALQERLSGA